MSVLSVLIVIPIVRQGGGGGGSAGEGGGRGREAEGAADAHPPGPLARSARATNSPAIYDDARGRLSGDFS